MYSEIDVHVQHVLLGLFHHQIYCNCNSSPNDHVVVSIYVSNTYTARVINASNIIAVRPLDKLWKQWVKVNLAIHNTYRATSYMYTSISIYTCLSGSYICPKNNIKYRSESHWPCNHTHNVQTNCICISICWWCEIMISFTRWRKTWTT